MLGCGGAGAKYNHFQSQWNIIGQIVILETKVEWRIIPHTLFMTEFNTYEGKMNEERKFSKVNAYSYTQVLFMGTEEGHLT